MVNTIISVIIESFMSKKYMDLYSLLAIHEQARGEMIESFEDVDESEIKKFTVDNIDWDEIMSEFLK